MIYKDATFLVIDDDDAFRLRLARALETRGIRVNETGDPEDAIKVVDGLQPTHIILDLRMPKRSGLDTLREIKTSPQSKVVILTGYGSIATALEAVREGALNYLTKPTDLDRILNAFSENPTTLTQAKPVPSLERVEWEHIERVMRESEGNVSKAAKLLGLHRRSLQRKLKSPPKD